MATNDEDDVKESLEKLLAATSLEDNLRTLIERSDFIWRPYVPLQVTEVDNGWRDYLNMVADIPFTCNVCGSDEGCDHLGPFNPDFPLMDVDIPATSRVTPLQYGELPRDTNPYGSSDIGIESALAPIVSLPDEVQRAIEVVIDCVAWGHILTIQRLKTIGFAAVIPSMRGFTKEDFDGISVHLDSVGSATPIPIPLKLYQLAILHNVSYYDLRKFYGNCETCEGTGSISERTESYSRYRSCNVCYGRRLDSVYIPRKT